MIIDCTSISEISINLSEFTRIEKYLHISLQLFSISLPCKAATSITITEPISIVNLTLQLKLIEGSLKEVILL